MIVKPYSFTVSLSCLDHSPFLGNMHTGKKKYFYICSFVLDAILLFFITNVHIIRLSKKSESLKNDHELQTILLFVVHPFPFSEHAL